MLVNIHHDSAKEHNRLLLAGIGFLVSIALLVWLSIAIYNKEFDRVTKVTVKADRAGLQLAKFGDVRLNGALVGQVRDDHAGRQGGRDPHRARPRRGEGDPRQHHRRDPPDDPVRAEVHRVQPSGRPFLGLAGATAT